MLILPENINKILLLTGNDITKRGKKYFEQDRVKPFMIDYKSDECFNANSIVIGTKKYSTHIKNENGKIQYSCNCPYFQDTKLYPCKHIIAMLFDMYVNFQSYYNLTKKQESKSISELEVDKKAYLKINENIDNMGDPYFKSKDSYSGTYLSYYENLELDNENDLKDNIRLVPLIDIYGFKDSKLRLYFKIGRDKFYIVKDIYELGYAIHENELIKFNKNFEIVPSLDVFDNASKKMAQIIVRSALEKSRMSDILYYTRDMKSEDRKYIDITETYLDEVFDIYKSKSIVSVNEKIEEIYFIDEDPKFCFDIKENNAGNLTIINNSSNFTIFTGLNYSYILIKNKLYRCSNKYSKNAIPFLKEFKKSSEDEYIISDDNKIAFYNFVLPRIKESISVNIEDSINEKYALQELVVKIYLDIDKNSNILAKVDFCYDDISFNPFLLNERDVMCNRNAIAEEKAKKTFAKYRFKVNENNGYMFLDNEDDIYSFFTSGIDTFINNFEVLITDKLKNKQIINTSTLNFGVKLKNDLLDIEFQGLDISEDDLKKMLEKYKLKKKYHRLKNGTFINLTGYGIEILSTLNEDAQVNESEILKGNITLPKYRALFLDNLLKNSDEINVNKSTDFRELIKDFSNFSDATYEVPKNLKANLRGYQVTGYNWLKTLSNYGFGGILADDMGLGKTLQIITLLLDDKNSCKGDNKTSLVVCPSSLYINWQKEITRFAPDLKSLVIFGNSKERENLLKKYNKFDIVITSYDMLKRDIELYKDIKFNFIIADEAQYIKNNNTKNAKALKKLNSNVRFALTGTPIENSLSELWSIFDYIMPGYLFSYSKFKNNYETLIIKEEDKKILEKLQKNVAPFILRRVKKEVLKELPEKTETIMYNKMEDEQKKVYDAYLYNAKKEVEANIKDIGFENSKMKILSSITRLRQICSHPKLFLDDYNGESSKLNQCVELIEEGVNSGHKILVFSSFTSVFDLLSIKLKEKGINYDILTGATKASTRVDMVEGFNISDSIKVFLISLKAGGTGLNLIGADMVIHFDPWWNLSAQNQATDRAYRIGQKSNVQVFRLITQNSIEEKILKLQEKKQDITDNVISSKETFISKMSKEEIMELFNI